MTVEEMELVEEVPITDTLSMPIDDQPDHIDPQGIRLFREPAWKLRMTIEGRSSYPKIKIVRAAPLTHPSQYICFLDEKDEVITMVNDPVELDAHTQEILQEELTGRYLTSVISQIHSVRSEYGVSYWDVATDRGRREFVVQNVSESAQWMTEKHLMLVDVDGNRFEIPDLEALDKKSLGYIGLVL